MNILLKSRTIPLSHKRLSSFSKVSIIERALQEPPQTRLSQEVLRKHTEMNAPLNSTAALVEQIQALTATHQQLANEMQALVKVLAASQHVVPASGNNAWPYSTLAALSVLCMLLGIVVARFIV